MTRITVDMIRTQYQDTNPPIHGKDPSIGWIGRQFRSELYNERHREWVRSEEAAGRSVGGLNY